MTTPMIVVAGLAVRDGKMLMQLRPRKDARGNPTLRPGLWEHPGGKVNPGENHSVALAREWREELASIKSVVGEDGAVAHITKPLQTAGCIGNRITTVYFTIERHIELSLFHVALPPELTITPLEADDVRWVDPLFAVEHMPLSPGSYLLYPWIRGFTTGDWSLVPSSHRFGASAS